MTNKLQLSSIAVLIGGLALTGCANKQSWSPELEDARATFQQVSSDPLVAELAGAELASAKQQLQAAENASDYFKSVEVISHEAALAKLKALEAQQTARSLAAKQNLRVAQNSVNVSEPIMAAATPSYSGSAQGGHSALESQIPQMPVAQQSETQQIAQQLAALGQQIALLQARIEGGAMQPAVSAQTVIRAPAVDYSHIYTEVAAQPVAQVKLEPQTSPRITTLLAEPQLGAAMAAPAEDISNERLYEELRAMNARPASRGMSLTLGERYFESDSARIWNGRAARHLDNIAAVMAENPELALDIEAHTDNSGSVDVRNNLSSDRAISVKSALVLRGVNAARINATGFGDSAPIADNATELGQLQNRRVEIIFPNVAAK